MAFLVPYTSLSPNQKSVIRNISREEGNLFVEGPPGSGKTLISLYTLRDVIETSTVQPLMLIYNHSLYGYLRTAVRELDLSDNITIATKDKFFKDLGSEHNIYFQGNTYDEKYSGLLNRLVGVDLDQNYDVVLVDEVQDLRAEEWSIIKKIAKRIVSLGDFDQGIYETKLTRSVVSKGESQKLKEIYRLPKNIAELAEEFSRSGDSLTSKVRKVENKVPQKFQVSEFSVNDKIAEILRGLRNVRERIGVVSPDSYFLKELSEDLSASGIDHDYYPNNYDLRDHDFTSNKPLLIGSFSTKGLEFEHLILFGFEKSSGTIKSLRSKDRLDDVIYVSLTRTNSSLYIITTDNTISEIAELEIADEQQRPDIEDIFG